MARGKSFNISINHDWCKDCGLCVAFCPTKVFDKTDRGQPFVKDKSACTGCMVCVLRCPDFALEVEEETA